MNDKMVSFRLRVSWIIAAAVAVLILVIALNINGGSHWPDSVRANFMRSCVAGDSSQINYCGCVADTMSESVAPHELEGMSMEDPRFTSAVDKCSSYLNK